MDCVGLDLWTGIDILADSPYLTLSHQWGTGPMYKLQTDKLSRLKEDIPLQDLSPTFQDAFEVTRYLGDSYTWIDSLCIVQNSSTDWDHKVHRMANIYYLAVCNLAATACDAEKGLLNKDSTKTSVCPTVSVDLKSDKEHLVGTFDIVSERGWSDHVKNAPLNRRAWVFLERFLSRRILHFTTNQIFYECPTARACETWPLPLPKNMDQRAH